MPRSKGTIKKPGVDIRLWLLSPSIEPCAVRMTPVVCLWSYSSLEVTCICDTIYRSQSIRMFTVLFSEYPLQRNIVCWNLRRYYFSEEIIIVNRHCLSEKGQLLKWTPQSISMLLIWRHFIGNWTELPKWCNSCGENRGRRGCPGVLGRRGG